MCHDSSCAAITGTPFRVNVVVITWKKDLRRFSVPPVDFCIYESSKRREVEKAIHAIMKALVSRIQDESDHDAQKHFGKYPSLRTQLSYGGYTTEAAELDKDIFSPFSSGSSQPAFTNMTLNFGTDETTDAFPALPAPVLPPAPNPWK